MLSGKGLTDWEWVYKTFPRWMLQEMDPQEPVDESKGVNKNDKGKHSEVPSHTIADDRRAKI